jgi:hypothetical protein
MIEAIELFLHGVRRLRTVRGRMPNVPVALKARSANEAWLVSQEWLDLRAGARALALAAGNIGL